MKILPKSIYRFSTVPPEFPADFVGEIDNLILSCIQICKRSRIIKIILKKKKVEDLTQSNFMS